MANEPRPSVDGRLAAAAIDHAVDVEQFGLGSSYRMLAVLNRADGELIGRIAAALSGVDPRTEWTVERLDQLLDSTRALNAEVYRNVETLLSAELGGFVVEEVSYQAGLYTSALPPAIVAQLALGVVDPFQLRAAALARPFQGRLLSSWAATIADNRMRMIRETIRQGFI